MLPPFATDISSGTRSSHAGDEVISPVPENESERLHALRLCGILDTADEQYFDDVAYLAKTICGAPIALVSLVDESRQWFKSRIGVEGREASRESSFCAHAILEPNRVFEVVDARADRRFASNPLVTGDPGIRFYAGAPIVLHAGRQSVRSA